MNKILMTLIVFHKRLTDSLVKTLAFVLQGRRGGADTVLIVASDKLKCCQDVQLQFFLFLAGFLVDLKTGFRRNTLECRYGTMC